MGRWGCIFAVLSVAGCASILPPDLERAQFDLVGGLPCLPRGVAGAFSGLADETLLLAGGTRWSKPPHEGGTKLWVDEVFALSPNQQAWRPVGRLERPLACGAAVSASAGLVVIGGCDATQCYRAVSLLTLRGSQVHLSAMADLPEPAAYLEGTRLGNTIYVAGGQRSVQATEALRTFWALDLTQPNAGWRALEPWPGPARIMPRVVTQDGAVFVFSGTELFANDKGEPARRFLKDAYRYRPGEGWTRVADLPQPVVAAPVVAWGRHSVLVFGGDNGQLADKGWTLADSHPGFSSALLRYDTATNTWSKVQNFPNMPVVSQASRHGNEILIPTGEDRPGHRTPVLYAYRVRKPLPKSQRVATTLEQTDLWQSGNGAYHTYRIPALITLANGDLLAFCEGRKGSQSDSGDIDLLLRRSSNGGRTWTDSQVVIDDGPNTAGNPCPVEDRTTGRLWLTFTKNFGDDVESRIMAGTSRGTRTMWVMYSDDHGATWSTPRDVSATAKRADWTWYATGPGIGIQLSSGRLLIPCDHAIAGTKTWGSHAVYSDDHGETWQIGGVMLDMVNECQAAELGDGSVLMNLRSYNGLRCRAVAISRDGGQAWGPVSHHPMLIEPVCQASLIRVNPAPGVTGNGNVLAFSNPASRLRQDMTVRLSFDGGATWPAARSLHSGPTAYSSLAATKNGGICCLYERGDRHPYERITFAQFDAGWILQPGQSETMVSD